MINLCLGTATSTLDHSTCCQQLDLLIDQLRARGPLRRVLLIPPDFTRVHSGAGPLTCYLYEQLRRDAEVVVLPALGTHFEMEVKERDEMFPGIPPSCFRTHDWRSGVVTLGEIPSEVISELSEGRIQTPVKVQVDRLLVQEAWDAIVSIGQLVPHEVIGIANQVKNVLVGAGGPDLIHKSHWLGAVYGMERIMGRAWTPVRSLLNWAAEHYLNELPITYLMTVRALDAEGRLVTRGLFAGDDGEAYLKGAELAREVNLDLLDHAPSKVVVYLDPQEFKSTWLGNKAIYRTRMALADGGELVILAPGVRQFGEDPEIDRLIRKYGYRGTPATVAAVEQNPELAANLSAAAHLIHGSSEGRFRVTYCPGHLTRQEVEDSGYQYGSLDEMLALYPPDQLKRGWNDWRGEEVFFVDNPALGLWGTADRFGAGQTA